MTEYNQETMARVPDAPPAIDLLNNDQRTPILLCLDTSGSVQGVIPELGNGLTTFEHDLKNDSVAANRVEIAIVTFGNGGVRVVQPFTSASSFQAPTLVAHGETPMGGAIHTSLDLVRDRKEYYKRQGIDFTRPLVFGVTDGCPTDDWEPAAARVRQEEANKHVAFFAIGYGNVDMATLTAIAPPNRPPLMLNGTRFRELFQWLSTSVCRVSASRTGAQVSLPPTDTWAVTTI